MDAHLTNYEFRGYRKATGHVWLHLRTHVVFLTGTSFSIEAYLRDITGVLTLANGAEWELDGVSIDVHSELKYDGARQVHGLSIVVPTDLTDVPPGVGHLRLAFHLDFHGAEMVAHHAHDVLIRRMYRSRRTSVKAG